VGGARPPPPSFAGTRAACSCSLSHPRPPFPPPSHGARGRGPERPQGAVYITDPCKSLIKSTADTVKRVSREPHSIKHRAGFCLSGLVSALRASFLPCGPRFCLSGLVSALRASFLPFGPRFCLSGLVSALRASFLPFGPRFCLLGLSAGLGGGEAPGRPWLKAPLTGCRTTGRTGVTRHLSATCFLCSWKCRRPWLKAPLTGCRTTGPAGGPGRKAMAQGEGGA
jgi:hypothetical protein